MYGNVPKSRTLAIHLFRNVQYGSPRLLHHGPDTVEEFLDRHIVKEERKSLNDDDNEILTRQQLTSTRREVLSLYMDIIRATRYFMWPDSRGILCRDILRENTRKEFRRPDPKGTRKLSRVCSLGVAMPCNLRFTSFLRNRSKRSRNNKAIQNLLQFCEWNLKTSMLF